jgi:translation initiation factor 1 (eIF-1/SUI1)
MNPFEENDEIDITEIKLIEIWVEINGRKKNTYVAGWNLSEPEIKEHIKMIKKKNGCNGTLKEITIDGNKSIKIIQLQGEHVDYLKSYLKEQNIDSSLIRVRG